MREQQRRRRGRMVENKTTKNRKRAVKIDAEVKWAWVDRANGFTRENTHTRLSRPSHLIRSTKQNAQVLFYSILKFTGWV